MRNHLGAAADNHLAEAAGKHLAGVAGNHPAGPAAVDTHPGGPAAAGAAGNRQGAPAVEAADNHPVPEEVGAAGNRQEAPAAEAADNHQEADSCRREAVGVAGWSRLPFSETHCSKLLACNMIGCYTRRLVNGAIGRLRMTNQTDTTTSATAADHRWCCQLVILRSTSRP